MDEKYLIYLDILGFEKLAEEIAKDKRIGTKTVRKHFIDVIKEKVKDIEAKHRIIGKHYGGSDDWILDYTRITISQLFRYKRYWSSYTCFSLHFL